MNCQSCGEEILDGNFCPKCGTKVNLVEKPKSSNLLLILLIGVGLVFFIIIAVAALLIYRTYYMGA